MLEFVTNTSSVLFKRIPLISYAYGSFGKHLINRQIPYQIVRGHLAMLHLGLELAIDPLPPGGNFVHYDFLKLHYIRH